MVDGVLLLVDAVEGPMPQTRFVTKKALALGLKPIVVVNKVDRPGSRPDWVINATFELFDKLGATEEQLDFPVVYASALNGWATLELAEAPRARAARPTDDAPLFDAILKHVPAHEGDGRRAAAAADLRRSTIPPTWAASASAASTAARSSRQNVVYAGPRASRFPGASTRC
jgi:predicted membrane GTPase involved in stress response